MGKCHILDYSMAEYPIADFTGQVLKVFGVLQLWAKQ